jgi:hypothetical protein
MFVVSEAAAAAIRTTCEREGELSAAIEVRRLFPGIAYNAKARECARAIAGWKPLPAAAACPRDRLQRQGAGMRPGHRRLETATCGGGLSHRPVTPSSDPGSADEAVIGLEPEVKPPP